MGWSLSDLLHKRSRNCTTLSDVLSGFIGGQFEITKKIDGDAVHRRGEIDEIEINDKVKEITVYFNWLCEEKLVHDNKLRTELKWVLVERPFRDLFLKKSSGKFFLKVPFGSYRSHPDEDRVKMWGGGWSEVCRFYKRDDHTNLVQNGAEIISYWELHRVSFFCAINIAIAMRKK
ncbi:MAG: hypothetical protein G01um101417_600 [Parcubacteria group bacterium Gr01-1014_17]|nr:MAG: hypothetical protein G01um101417_600 [Parcubacteria group bacterium Gr01-1014_17]